MWQNSGCNMSKLCQNVLSFMLFRSQIIFIIFHASSSGKNCVCTLGYFLAWTIVHWFYMLSSLCCESDSSSTISFGPRAKRMMQLAQAKINSSQISRQECTQVLQWPPCNDGKATSIFSQSDYVQLYLRCILSVFSLWKERTLDTSRNKIVETFLAKSDKFLLKCIQNVFLVYFECILALILNLVWKQL